MRDGYVVLIDCHFVGETRYLPNKSATNSKQIKSHGLRVTHWTHPPH